MTTTRFGNTGTLVRRKDDFKFTMTFGNGITTSRVLDYTDPNTILNDLKESLNNPHLGDLQHQVFRMMTGEMRDMLYYMLRYDQLGNWGELIPEYKMYDCEV